MKNTKEVIAKLTYIGYVMVYMLFRLVQAASLAWGYLFEMFKDVVLGEGCVACVVRLRVRVPSGQFSAPRHLLLVPVHDRSVGFALEFLSLSKASQGTHYSRQLLNVRCLFYPGFLLTGASR